jgi:hypothetical protein
VFHCSRLSAGLKVAQAQNGDFGLPLERAFFLVLGGYAEDVPQLMVHLVDPVGGGRG